MEKVLIGLGRGLEAQLPVTGHRIVEKHDGVAQGVVVQHLFQLLRRQIALFIFMAKLILIIGAEDEHSVDLLDVEGFVEEIQRRHLSTEGCVLRLFHGSTDKTAIKRLK